MAIANGIVVSPPTITSAKPVAFMASLLSRREINMPMPTPSATRVPVQSTISGKVTFFSIIAFPLTMDFGVKMRAQNVGMAAE
jgi:hypothetical protein